MDYKKHNGAQKNKGKKTPKVPLKTYCWEDLRRSRRRGGYPWTYLYKQPFSEEIDPEEYTMEAMRRSKSSSTMGKSDGVEILEIVSQSGRSSSGTLEPPVNEIVTEPSEEDLNKNKEHFSLPEDSVQIEECQNVEQEHEMESAASSDNVSQYLDKEELVSQKPLNSDTNKSDVNNEERSKRAKSEETQPRKRKLSAESSYSRISLSRLGMMKKLRDVKTKIKPSKLTFSASKFKIPLPKKATKEASESKKESSKKITDVTATKVKNPEKPVYIHIPLKPPEGAPDEISHSETEKIGASSEPTLKVDEEKAQSTFKKAPELRTSRKGPLKINPAFKQLLKDVKQLGEEGKKNTDNQQPSQSPMEVTESEQKPQEAMEIDKHVTPMETDCEEMILDTDEAQDISELKFQKPTHNIKLTTDLPKTEEAGESTKTIDTTESPKTSEPTEETTDTDASKPDEDVFEDLFKASRTENLKVPEPIDQRKVRSKSAEPERKRKLSIDSSYSRKSTSKLGLMKKLKDASDKIKGAFSLSSLRKEKPPISKKDEIKHSEERKKLKAVDILKPAAKIDPSTVKPVYIHIPLKPPPGQTDEFSYLEFSEKRVEPTQPTSTGSDAIAKEPQTPQSSSPGSPPQTAKDIQFIFLTPPSDDETLNEKTPDIPETPCSENSVFFGTKINELKQLAQNAVDQVSPETRRKKALEPVSEESSSENSLRFGETDGQNDGRKDKKNDNVPEEIETDKAEQKGINETLVIEVEPSIDKIKEEKMTIDVEDGLSEARSKPDELKSSLKSEVSPIMKKKVSFKRRSKTPKDTQDSEKESEYEEITAPKDEAKVSEVKKEDCVTVEKKDEDTKEKDISLLQTSQSVSMSADEEKSYLDQKIVKDTSLEEDYNKWSKASDHDHEYEPINPPDEVTFTTPPVTSSINATTLDDDKEPSRISPLKTETVIVQTQPVKPKESFTSRIFHFHHSDNEDDEPTSKTQSSQKSGSEDTKSKPASEGPGRIQMAFKHKTDQIKNKFHNMKKPNITLPQRPKFNRPDFKKFKIEKPKFNLPKIPDTIAFQMPRKSTTTTTVSSKRSLTKRNLSTESNDGDSKKPIFDFSTYPRLFKKKPKKPLSNDAEIPNYATSPRQKKTTESSEASSIRIPLHSEDSMDTENNRNVDEQEFDREDSVERRMAESSRMRYKDIDIDDDYARENQEINKAERWQHGSFNPHQHQEDTTFEERFRQQQEDFDEHFRNSQYKVTDLDSPEDENREFAAGQPMRDGYSSEGSAGGPSPRPGVLEEIDSDQFIVREKGLSQDNIEIGQWISSEIREAFRTPTNALNEIRGSNQSLPLDNAATRKKPVRKPKRKKTPHVSQEQLRYEDESLEDLGQVEDVLPPARPKRRSKRTRKPKNEPGVVPYQETIAVDEDISRDRLQYQRESLAGILGDDERDDMEFQMYENEKMAGKDQPDIKISDAYRHFEFVNAEQRHGQPTAPPRAHRSLRSLTISENDSMAGYNLRYDQEEANNELNRRTEDELHQYIIPSTHEEPPKRPARSRSHASSLSRGTSLKETESLTRTESYTSENQENQIPCVEEPCVQDIRDCMGYAVVDKNKPRDPPLPPPRTIVRRKKRSTIEPDMKFSTVPRVTNKDEVVPVRPLRNYSTLQQVKQRPTVLDPIVYENKENIIQYVEIDDDVNRDLQSGDVIEKMKSRPLPAPPRPPRKTKGIRLSLQDITSQSNILLDDQDLEDKQQVQEETVSTQTEPLPEGFVCEELVQEPTDTLIEPSQQRKTNDETTVTVERRLITPTHYTYEETVTHGALVVEPLNGSQILPQSELSKERIVPVSREDSDEETSNIPVAFAKLQDPKPRSNPEVIQAQKLQISDLDVDRLRVSQLVANKIVVSEIESGSIQANEIQSKTGDLKVNEISLPPELVQEIVRSLRATAQEEAKVEQKKTPIRDETDRKSIEDDEICNNSEINSGAPPTPPPRISSQPLESIDKESRKSAERRSQSPPTSFQTIDPQEGATTPSSQHFTHTAPIPLHDASDIRNESLQTPQRPPRQTQRMLEPDIDDEPPPRPPQPEVDDGPPPPRPPEPEASYFPSQPPASFYALRAAQFVENLDQEENIPVVPRRSRRHKRPMSRSHSTSEESSGAPVTRNRHFRRSSESSIPDLTGRLMRACGESVNASIKRLIFHVSNNVLGNADGKQDIHVMIVILLVLIAGLILLGYGDEKTVVHLHHWEYFNPPKDM